eukprot:TRINITY_DN6081_c0_g1_i2.p1 TRINITY_DN6081_c0_g1~~TRINITY_DN6081_c0_g1_i2.p1  ORF type:complete len:325 (+),score=57.13 TRINITY_DN6081_c0_g1_i2:121-1095(+)
MEIRYSLCFIFCLFGLVTVSLVMGRSKRSPTLLRSQVSSEAFVSTAHESLRDLDLQDIFISVKTSHQFHETRLPLILQTWFTLARQHIWFFTDKRDGDLEAQTNGHLIPTKCGPTHQRQDLCCKMAAEFDAFIKSGRKWFCHFDDDNYVNVFALLRELKKYDHREDWYLGKPSLPGSFEMMDRHNSNKKIHFRFATGGAGICISGTLARKMHSTIGNGQFAAIGERIRLPDDVTFGYIVDNLFNTKLTVIDKFHSHLEPQRFIDVENNEEAFRNQISFGYHRYGAEMNALNIEGIFTEDEDPSRFKSLHCKLFPNFNWCPKKKD